MNGETDASMRVLVEHSGLMAQTVWVSEPYLDARHLLLHHAAVVGVHGRQVGDGALCRGGGKVVRG